MQEDNGFGVDAFVRTIRRWLRKDSIEEIRAVLEGLIPLFLALQAGGICSNAEYTSIFAAYTTFMTAEPKHMAKKLKNAQKTSARVLGNEGHEMQDLLVEYSGRYYAGLKQYDAPLRRHITGFFFLSVTKTT